MDATYDSYENYRFAVEEIGAVPIITLNPRGRVDAITEGSLYLADDGTYTYVAGFEVVYWDKDKVESPEVPLSSSYGQVPVPLSLLTTLHTLITPVEKECRNDRMIALWINNDENEDHNTCKINMAALEVTILGFVQPRCVQQKVIKGHPKNL